MIEQIKQSIQLGDLNAGDKLPSERELAAALSISRSAVREAISVLQSAGTVEIRPGIGVFLIEGKADDLILRINYILDQRSSHVLELLELRQGVESQAAHLAALRADDTAKHNILQSYMKLESAVSRNEVAADEDFQFHLAVVQASGNQMLNDVIRLISGNFKEGLVQSRKESLSIPGKTRIVLSEHKEIMEAIAAGDAEKARLTMWRHIENVKRRFQ